MQIVIEFYRMRDADCSHALIGCKTGETAELDDALGLARRLWQTLDMPHRLDGISITGATGAAL